MFERIEEEFLDDRFMLWIGYQLRGEEEQSIELLKDLDEAREFQLLDDYIGYPSFDPTPFPNLAARLEAMGAGERVLQPLPYRCSY